MVIIDRDAYTQEGCSQLSKPLLCEVTEEDLTGKVIHRIKLHAHDMLQEVK